MGDYRERATDGISSRKRPRVLVTGFGPFGEHSINASWECVKALRTLPDLNQLVDLFVVEIPVKYSDVSATVPDLWKKYQPDLVIHCGVSGLLAWKNAIQVERHAHCHGYHRPDVESRTPDKGFCALDDGEKCLTTGVNLDSLHTWIAVPEDNDRREDKQLTCQVSNDAGRFLCEFIYYASLRINQDSTLFIHVPPLYKPFSEHEIALAIKTVILKVLECKKLIVMTLEEERGVADVQHVVLGLDSLEEFPALI